MRLRYTRPALADLASILDYIADHSPQGASRIHGRIQTVIGLLLSQPMELANNITAIFAAVLVAGGLLAWKGQPAKLAAK